jgi:hypothetical protein
MISHAQEGCLVRRGATQSEGVVKEHKAESSVIDREQVVGVDRDSPQRDAALRQAFGPRGSSGRGLSRSPAQDLELVGALDVLLHDVVDLVAQATS